MENKGIKHQLTAPHTPQQNNVAEHANRTVAEAAQAMLQSAGMSNGFWECAVSTAIHVCNRAPSRVNNYIFTRNNWILLISMFLDASLMPI